MTADQLAALLHSPTPHALLDVRERATYERGHVFRATSLPRRLLELRAERLITARPTPIVLCDADETVAELARRTLTTMGYSEVRVLRGGLAAWRESGRSLVQGINVPSKVFGERALHAMKTPQISARDLAERIERRDDMVIVDARTREEYARGCIPGAWSMPGGELALRIAELAPDPDTTIVVHCGGRTRSYIGAESIRRLELPNPVVALENGTMGWELAGLSLERGASRWAPPISARSLAAARRAAQRVAAEDGIVFVTADEVQSLWARRDRDNVYLLDVRTPEEYASGHIAGAISAPGGQAVQATDEYVAVRAASIVLVSGDDEGLRAIMTAAWYQRMGFPNVYVLRGDLTDWIDGGGGVEEGDSPPRPFGYAEARARTATLAPAALERALRDDPPLVVDVDTSDVYSRGHVPGAGWLCRSRLELRIGEVARSRTDSLVIVSEDGVTATLAAVALAGLGYSGARVLEGGTRAWEAAGFSLERGATLLLDEADDVVLKPYERGRDAMEAYLRWEEQLDDEGRSPSALLPERR